MTKSHMECSSAVSNFSCDNYRTCYYYQIHFEWSTPNEKLAISVYEDIDEPFAVNLLDSII